MRKLIFLSFLSLSSFLSKGQVAISGSSSIILDAKKDKDTLMVLLTPEAGSDWSSFQGEGSWPSTVRLNGASRKSFTDAISVQKDPANPGLIVTVDMARLNSQGSYEVTVAYKTDKTPHGRLSFTLVRPTAALEAGKTVHISFQGSDTVMEALALRETAGQSNIYGLHLPSPVVSSLSSGDLIKFSDSSYNVAAGNYLRGNYRIDGDLAEALPLGTTTGKMVITAPELATPVEVSFEIQKKRSLWVIFFVTLAGLLLGFLVRVVLQQKKAAEKSRFNGFLLAKFIREDSEAVKDPGFTADVNSMLSDLAKFLEPNGLVEFITGPDKNLDSQVAGIQKRYEDRKATLDADLKVVKDQFSLLADAVNNPLLSPHLQTLLEGSRTALEKLKAAIASKDLAGSGAQLSLAMQALKGFANDFKKNLDRRINFLSLRDAYPKTSVTDDTFTKLTNVLAGIRTEATAVTPDTAKPEDASRLLLAISSLQNKMIDFFDTAVDAVSGDIKKGREPIFTSGTLKESYTLWMQELGAYIHNAGAVSDEAEARIKQLAAALDEKITAVAANLRQGGDSQPPSFALSGQTVVSAINKDFSGEEGKRFIAQGLVQTGRAFFLFALLQTLFLAIILGLAAVKLNAPHFTGTTDDLITIFFFAFTIDLTVDNVVAKVKQG